MRSRRFLAAAVTLIAVAPLVASADDDRACPPGGELHVPALASEQEEIARVAELAGAVETRSRLIRRGGGHAERVCDGVAFPWPAFAPPSGGDGEPRPSLAVERLPLRLVTVFSSTYPVGGNDGLLWSGRGVSQHLAGGVEVRWGPLSAAVAPEVAWSENRAFDLVATGRPGDLAFANPYYGNAIDLPQRFGAGPFATWSPGQSYLRVDLWNVALGISSENLRLGPGIRNAILLSDAGPGFPHVFLGTTRPADVWIGKAEALLFWGRLDRTRFIEGGGHPLVSGLAVTYEPRWIPGLSLGAARVFVQRWEDLTLRNWLAIFQSLEKQSLQDEYGPTGDNANDNQLASVFGRWVFPEAGLEIYGEWAREDYDWSWWGTLREPDHSQAYLVGLQKVFRAGSRIVRLHLEATHLQELRPLDNERGVPVFYTHGRDTSYTNQGQLLGAWIGPGADSQTLAVDVFHRGGRIGGYLERVRRNDAYYWAVIEPVQGDFSHDAEIALGFRQALTAGAFEITWEAAAAYRQNRDFIRHEPNVKLALGLSFPAAASRSP
jgi:hypothetical protein